MILSPSDLARVQAISDRLGQIQATYAEASRLLAGLTPEQDHDQEER